MVKSERRRLRLGKEEGDAIEMEKIRGLRFWGRASGNFFKNTGAAERVGAEELSAEERKKRGLCPWRVETQLPMVAKDPTKLNQAAGGLQHGFISACCAASHR